jgi:hypothetical protein
MKIQDVLEEICNIAERYTKAVRAQHPALGPQADTDLKRIAELHAIGVKLTQPSGPRPLTLLVDGVETSYATDVRIGGLVSCHILVVPGPNVHAMLTRRRDGYIWLANLHPDCAGVAIKPANQPRITVTNSTVVLPGTTVYVGNREIRVVDC